MILHFPSCYRFAPPPPPPQPDPPSGPGKPAAQPASKILSGKRIVIIEDEGVTQMQLRMILTRAGLRVIGAASRGEDAVDLVLKERPDLVLMDIKMPGQIDGLEAARQILAQHHVCIVMLTAYDTHRAEAAQIGACGYVIKPVNSASLVPELERAFTAFNPH